MSRGPLAWAVCTALLLPAAAGAELPTRKDFRRGDDRPFSDAVLVGDTLYLAGKLGLDPATRQPPADPAQEARNVLDAVKTSLLAAGFSMDDLVSVQVFCSDVKHYDTFNDVYRGYFKGAFPARAFIGSGPLLFGARFEVQGIAARTRPAGK